MKRYYKNSLDLNTSLNPKERREEISREIVRHEDYLPQPTLYEDIDKSFKEWVENNINLVQDNIKLPTMVLYSNQRFSEYSQTWSFTDENNNIRLNFLTITRENNPSHGTIVGETYNIPGDRFYPLKKLDVIDESGKKYKLVYKMKQPTPVDIRYKVSVMTNKYKTLNSFNEIVNTLFNSMQQYICPNGHYMSFVIETINDESEYNISDRQFFSQTFNVKLKGYLIKEEDFKIEEIPAYTIMCFEGDDAKRKKPTIELIEYDPCYHKDEDEKEEYYTKEIEIDIDTTFCFPHNGKIKFTIDEEFILTKMSFKEPNNIIEDDIELYLNDELITNNLKRDAYEGYKILENKPNNANDENTLIVDKLPEIKEKKYKYILFDNNYYIWHEIHFYDGDEIVIKTKRQDRYNSTGGLILNGYNIFVLKTKQ